MSDQKYSSGVWDTGHHVGSTSKEDMSDINRTLGPMIGIDLGTSNSCVSLWHTVKNRAKVIKNVSTKSKCTSHKKSTVGFSAHKKLLLQIQAMNPFIDFLRLHV